MSNVVLSKPLDIAAPDLLRAVPFTHSGTLHVQVRRRLGKKKWQSRYVVISQGYLYVYEDKNAKHTDNSYPIKQFESVKDFDGDSDESFCFCIKYEIPTKKPLIFASDTYNNRMVWINEVGNAIQEVQQFSADSGFGSAGTFPSRNSGYASRRVFPSRDNGIPDEADQKGYEEILDWHIKTNGPGPIQESLGSLKRSNNSSSMLSVGSGERTLHNDGFVSARTSDKRLHRQNQETMYANTGQRNEDHFHTLSLTSFKEDIDNDSVYINTGATGEDIQAVDSSPFLSVSGPADSVDEDENDSSSCSSETVCKTVYESPEEDADTIYANTEFFKTTDYYCDSKKNGRSKLQTKSTGTFLVCPGETTKDLCVKTSNGIISFRIYEQNGRMSLYKEFSKTCCIFPTLDALLRYYHVYELPSKTYKVNLTRGLNTAA